VSTELYNYHSTLRQVFWSHLRFQILLDPHIEIFGAQCLNALNILKYFSPPHRLFSQTPPTAIPIRSQLDYAAPIYSPLNYLTQFNHLVLNWLLVLLAPVQHSAYALRLVFLHSSIAFFHLRPTFSPLQPNTLISPSSSNALYPQNSLLLSLQSHLRRHLKLEPLPPIFSSISPWLTPRPNMRCYLTKIPKTANFIYKQRINEIIISEFSSHLLCFTDGSKSGSRTGYAISI